MTELTNEYVLSRLKEAFGESIISHEEPFGLLTITLKPEVNLEVLRFLWNDPELQIQFMTDLCGLHFPDQPLPLGVVYHLHSLIKNFRIRLKFFLPLDNPSIRSATPVYASANWMERETYDFYGILFEGHSNLSRILNIDQMEVFPMRKEYPLEDPNRVDKKDSYFGR